MEGQPHLSLDDHNLNNFSDLNYGDEIEGAYGCDEPLFGEPSLPNNEEANATNEVETPNLVVEELESRLAIGQIVEDEDIAYALYSKYASAMGFSVRRGWPVYFKDGSGLLQGKYFLCSCEGGKDVKCSETKVPKYQKRTFRCDCKAKLKIARKKGQPWKVTIFQKEHNHELYAVGQTYLLRSSRKLTDEQELLLTTMVKSKISVSKAIALLQNMAQGKENVGFLPTDAYDYLRKSEKKGMENGDTFKVFKHFKDKSNSESNFYWNMEVDDDNRLVNFFFRDYRCLIDFQHCGDVLSFDTTYRTNKYELICAPFVGINHHNENVMFGIAFMSDETQSSFEWLFRIFLESMGGKQPETIFTDQCQAMMNAIEKVFPCSRHRLCQWHINQNATSHFGNLKSDSKFKHLWEKCMNYCESEEEFESTWKEMVDTYEIDKQNWFNIMYNLRHKWSTSFSTQIFCASLHATSRSEGTNTALKKIIGNKTSYLIDCVIGYEMLQDNWLVSEKENDTLCHHNKPTPIVPDNPLLIHAADVYTFKIYKLFEKEFLATLSFEQPQQFRCEGSPLIFFKVKSHKEGSRFKVVEYDSEKLELKCSCHKFETGGILCSHALKVLDVLNMHVILEKYIKKRWTMFAKSGACDGQSTSRSGKSGNGGGLSFVNEMAFVNYVIKEIHDLALQGKSLMEGRDIIIECIESAKGRMSLLFKNMSLKDSVACDNFVPVEDYNNLDKVHVREPLIAKSRGVTNVQKRHWDDKSKKGKGKSESSKRTTKGMKRKSQNSQTQEAAFPQQLQPLHYQMQFETTSSITPFMGGYDNLSQEHPNQDWSRL